MPASPIARRFVNSPGLLILVVIALMFAGLVLPLRLPIGPQYWDLAIYLDGAHRIANGQLPNVDFQTPAGPLAYYLFYILNLVFPNAHPLLSTQWSGLLVALPLFAVVAANIDRQSRTLTLALTLPFLCFALLPLNSSQTYPAPGLDGYGIYNRHPALLLYILVAALLFVRQRALLQVILFFVMLCLLLTKITGFATACMLVAYAILVGRLRILDTGLTAICVLACLAIIEAATGIVSAYAGNILQLTALNEDSFARRMRGFAGANIDLAAIIVFVIALLAWLDYRDAQTRASEPPGFIGRLRAFLDSGAAWLGFTAAAAIVFELQNTGSQEFIYLWPAMLAILRRVWREQNHFRTTVIAALLVATLPAINSLAQRAMRVILSAPAYHALDVPRTGPLGRVSVRNSFVGRSLALNEHYAANIEAYRTLSRKGYAYSDIYAAEPDYQITWLMNLDAAVRALLAYEASTGRKLETIYTLDFTDPLPFLLGRRPIRHVQIGLDARRTMVPGDKRFLASVASADGLLLPLCPITPMRDRTATQFAPAMEGRQRIRLTPCWDLLIRNGSDFALAR